MRIVIDLQGAQTESRFRGIGRYCMSMAQAMVRNRGNHEIIIALNGLFPDTIEPIRAAFDNLLPQENIRVWEASGSVRECEPGNSWRRETAELIREAFLASLNPDIVHIMSLFEGYGDDAVTSIGMLDHTTPVSTLLYDLIPLLNPEHYLKSDPAFEIYYLRKADYLQCTSLILSISEHSRREAIDNLGHESTTIVNVSTAADPRFHQLTLDSSQAQLIRDKFGISRPFVLCTGGADERKNLPRLISAYAQLSDQIRNEHQLVFTGKIPDENINHLKSEAKNAGLQPNEAVFTGYVTDDELAGLYNMCKVFVFPSWHEGFGLPALEAMSCSAAVIGSNTSSLPEVIGCSDALFNPFKTASINKKLAEVLTNDELRIKLCNNGIKQASNFSWDKSAQRALSAIEHTANTSIARAKQPDYDAILSRLISAIASVSAINLHTDEYASIARAISISLPDKRSNQLFVDVSELAQRDSKTGVQRVTRSILKELLATPPAGFEVRPVYAERSDSSYRYARKFTSQLLEKPYTGNDEYIEFQNGDIFLGLDLQHYTTQNLAEHLAEMRRYGVKIYFVVYDLLPILFPHYWPSHLSIHTDHAEWIRVIAQYDGALCISRAVADELAEWLGENGPERLRPFKIDWFHLGADVENSLPSTGMPEDAEHVLSILRNRTTFLMVGTVEPRKGYTQTLSAFDQLWVENTDVNLVIVGKEGWTVENLVRNLRNHPETGNRLFWLDGISDEYLDRLYASSNCLIVASEGEGFGLPIVEAAKHNLPVIARDIPVFREVAGDHALYFGGTDPKGLAESIRQWLELYKSNIHPKTKSMPWITWKQSAAQLLSALGMSSDEPIVEITHAKDINMKQEREAEVDIGGRRYLISSDDEYLEHIKNGFEPEMVGLFRTLASNSKVVLDIGANIGCTSLLFSELSEHVYAFEPSPTTYRFLEKNISNSGLGNITPQNIGLGAEPTETTLTFSPANRSGGFISNKTQAGEGHVVEKISIQILDDVVNHLNLKHLDFIKIDVEGFEGDVLRGAEKTLLKFKPTVVIKLNHWCLNVFQRTSVPDFLDQLRSIFPLLLAVHGNCYLDIHDESDSYRIMYEHILDMKFLNIVACFDKSRLDRFLSNYTRCQ